MSSNICESCGQIIPEMAAVCPHCGARRSRLPRRRKAQAGESASKPQGSISGEWIGASLLLGVGLGLQAENAGWYEAPYRGYIISAVCLSLLVLLRLRNWWRDR